MQNDGIQAYLGLGRKEMEQLSGYHLRVGNKEE